LFQFYFSYILDVTTALAYKKVKWDGNSILKGHGSDATCSLLGPSIIDNSTLHVPAVLFWPHRFCCSKHLTLKNEH